MKGIFYAVGVGPGDPELMTIKAANTVQACDLVAVADSGAQECIALSIAREWVCGKPVLRLKMPMTRDPVALDAHHRAAARSVAECLDAGRSVAFLTPGDPAIYASCMYVHALLRDMGHDARMVPGVPSFCAAAAALNEPLCLGDRVLTVIPAGCERGAAGVRIHMKAGKALRELARQTPGARVVERASMPDQRVFRDVADLPEDLHYFTLLIAGEDET